MSVPASDHSPARHSPVVHLFRLGYLKLIYLMIASLKQVSALAQRKNDRVLARADGRAHS